MVGNTLKEYFVQVLEVPESDIKRIHPLLDRDVYCCHFYNGRKVQATGQMMYYKMKSSNWVFQRSRTCWPEWVWKVLTFVTNIRNINFQDRGVWMRKPWNLK